MSAPSITVRNSADLHERLPAWRARFEEERTFLLAQAFIMAAEREAFPTLADNQATIALVAATDAARGEFEDALARMDHGDYGSYLARGRAIHTDRLDVLPKSPRPCQRERRPGHLSRTNPPRAHATDDFSGHTDRAAGRSTYATSRNER